MSKFEMPTRFEALSDEHKGAVLLLLDKLEEIEETQRNYEHIAMYGRSRKRLIEQCVYRPGNNNASILELGYCFSSSLNVTEEIPAKIEYHMSEISRLFQNEINKRG